MTGRAPGASAQLGTGYLGPDRTPVATFLRLAGYLACMRAIALSHKYAVPVKNPGPPLSPIATGQLRDILTREVCHYFEVTPLELMSPRRTQDITDARATLYFLLQQDARMGFSAIGRFLNKDHTTVMYGYRKANAQSVEVIRGKIAAGARS